MSPGRRLQLLGILAMLTGVVLGIVLGIGRDDSKSLWWDVLGLVLGFALIYTGRAMDRR